MPKINLRYIPTTELRAELARRSFTEPKVEPVKPQKWVCQCGNTVYGGASFAAAFVLYDSVWCRICIPNGLPHIYGDQGPIADRAMVQMDADAP